MTVLDLIVNVLLLKIHTIFVKLGKQLIRKQLKLLTNDKIL
jgi:hypothetical protein